MRYAAMFGIAIFGAGLLGSVWLAWQEPVFYQAADWTIFAGGLGLLCVGVGLAGLIAEWRGRHASAD